MELILKRLLHYPNAVHGRIFLDGNPICCTLENPKTCLPEGRYIIKKNKALEYQDKLYDVYANSNAAKTVLATIGKGNGIANMHNANILCGVFQCQGLVIKGREYLLRLEKAIGNTKKLVIKDEGLAIID